MAKNSAFALINTKKYALFQIPKWKLMHKQVWIPIIFLSDDHCRSSPKLCFIFFQDPATHWQTAAVAKRMRLCLSNSMWATPYVPFLKQVFFLRNYVAFSFQIIKCKWHWGPQKWWTISEKTAAVLDDQMSPDHTQGTKNRSTHWANIHFDR